MPASGFGWGAIGVILGAIITGLFGWLAQRGKSTAEIEVAVMAEWQKLNAALSERVSALERELSEVRRTHAKELDEMRDKHRAEMRRLRELNEGLQRQIAQNSQSTAHLMGEPGEKKP
jgi:hypothetical protein